jgi:hypothetical protein
MLRTRKLAHNMNPTAGMMTRASVKGPDMDRNGVRMGNQLTVPTGDAGYWLVFASVAGIECRGGRIRGIPFKSRRPTLNIAGYRIVR